MHNHKQDLEDAYNKGSKAYADGKDLDDCPYEWSCLLGREWRKGWYANLGKPDSIFG